MSSNHSILRVRNKKVQGGGDVIKRRFWREKWIGNYAFYCGLLSKGDIRFGISVGNQNAQIDLFNFTFGYMK